MSLPLRSRKTRTVCRPQLEQLETRVVLSANVTLTHGVLRAVCDNQPTTVTLSQSGATTILNGVRKPTAKVSRIEILGGAAGDTIRVLGTSAGTPVVVRGNGGNDLVQVSTVLNVADVVLYGGGGVNTLTCPNGANVWRINRRDGGTLNSAELSFKNFANLIGGAADDTFVLAAGQGVGGTIDGGLGVNALDYAAYTTRVSVDLAAGTATNVAGGIRGIQNAFGGAGNDVLVGDPLDNVLHGRGGRDRITGGGGQDAFDLNLADDPVLGPLAVRLDRDLDLIPYPEEQFVNMAGRGEKWLLDATQRQYYFILPNGELYRWDGSSDSDGGDVASGELVATLDPSYHADVHKLTRAESLREAGVIQGRVAELAARLDRDLGLHVQGEDAYLNWAGRGEKRLLNAAHTQGYFILPNGEFYRWDGSLDSDGRATANGELLATLDPSYYQELSKLTEAAAHFGNRVTATFDRADGVLRVEGTDNADDIRVVSSGNGNHTVSVLLGDGTVIPITIIDGATTTQADSVHVLFVGRVEVHAWGGTDRVGFDDAEAFVPRTAHLFGGEDGDTLVGGKGDDVLHGDGGDDLIVGQGGNDTLFGGAGADTVGHTPFGDDPGDDLMFGGTENDTIGGGTGFDTVHGEDGNDHLFGWTGNDYLDGGANEDVIGHFNNFDDPDHDTMVGGTGNDTVNGGSGNDLLWGDWENDPGVTNGHDTVIGGAGDDTLHGGAGDDTMWGDWENDGATVGHDWLFGGAGNDTQHGGGGNDSLFGQDHDDEMHGADGNDWLWGGQGGDKLFGWNDDDRLDGEGGNDILGGGRGDDTLRGGAEDDWLFGDENNDVLYGAAGLDRLFGGEGNDGLFGGVGWVDELTGGGGSDRFLRSDEDTAMDRTPDVDALIRFVGDGTAVWTDGEIEVLDKGLHWLHQIRGNAWLINWNGDDEQTMERVLSLGTSVMADNDSEGRIRVADWAFAAAIPADVTIVHEIGHNWDEESPIWEEWQGMSGWDSLGLFEGVDDGQWESLDGDWAYDASAPFARIDTLNPDGSVTFDSYGRTNPMEDWSTFWEAAYIDQTYPSSAGLRLTYNFGSWPPFQAKLQRVLRFIQFGT